MEPEPRVISVLREFRQALDSKEESLLLDMGRHWLTVEARLDADITALAYEMNMRREAGREVTQQILWREERYKIIKAQLEEQVKRYNSEYAIGAVSRAQEEYAELGIRSAQQAIENSYLSLGGFAPASPAWTRINVGAVENMIGFLGNGSPLNTLLKNAYPDALEGLSNALINGIARGLGPAAIARAMADGMGMGLDRALLIARTETLRAYRTASTAQYRESGVVSGFYRLVTKSKACMACLMLDGEWFALESDLYDHPRGGCGTVPAVKGVKPPSWEKGPEYFAKLSPEEQRARMGGERYEMWQSGKFKLEDLVRTSHSDEWGDSPRVARLSELTL